MLKLWKKLKLSTKKSIENDNLGDELIGASKAKLRSAFGKSMKGKVTSRQLLNKFVKLVA